MKSSSLDPQVDVSNATSNAFIEISAEKNKRAHSVLTLDSLSDASDTVSRVKVYTPFDGKTHTYFHSLSIDKDIADFMGTAELHCPYDRDIMGYWEPARAYCIIYGTNKGSYKPLFIGRVREINQQGYEIVISLQDYGWKFKQLISQSYSNDNILNKDGYTIMKLIFEALKIDSWVITPTAKYRLQQVGIDEDGNVTLNKKKVEEMPNLLNRLKYTNPKSSINKYTIYNKAKESEVHNVNHINYTLRYEKPTKIMKATAKSSNYSKGKDIYGTNYGKSNNSGGGGSGSSKSKNKASSNINASGHPRPPQWVCSIVKSTTINSAMRLVWSYNRGFANNYQSALNAIRTYAQTYPAAYRSQAAPCLATMSKLCKRKDGINSAAIIKATCDRVAINTEAARRSNSPKLRNYAAEKMQQRAKANSNKKTKIFGIF